jgi:hypothetical protein
MRFVLFLTLTLNASEAAAAAARPLGLLVVILVGGIAAATVSLVLGLVPGAHRRAVTQRAVTTTGPHPTALQRYRRWKRTLAHRAGWQYAIRLGTCLVVAALARHLWPAHHLHWIALVVAILTQRHVEPLPIKTTQRALGTVVGVAAAGVFVVFRPPLWGLVVSIGVLAGLRPLLKARSYLAYTAVMTPLIVLLMGASGPLDASILTDRLIATLAGAGLVVAANLLAGWWLTVPVTDQPG